MSINEVMLDKFLSAAKLIEHDGKDGIEAAAKLVGPEVAAGMLVSFLMAKKNLGYPVTDDVTEEIKEIFIQTALVD